MSFDSKPAEYPILIAVSILSPVKTHIWIPASFNALIVKGTSSYNLSSIAVEPTNSKFFSISSYKNSSSQSFPSVNIIAYSNLLLQFSYSSSDIIHSASKSVLNPVEANLFTNFIVWKTYWVFLDFNLSNIIESAPFVKIFIYPLFYLTIADILFLADENSITFNSFSSNVSLLSIWICMLSSSQPTNLYPKYAAAFTKANSSGDVALNFFIPFVSLIMTVWQAAKWVR